MISAYANAYALLKANHYREVAVRSAQFLLKELYNPETGRLQRVYRNGESREPGNLEDYADFAGGLVDLYRATGDEKWLDLAVRLTEPQIDLLYDRENGGFYDSSGEDRSLLVRSKECYGGALPSGNAMALTVLVELHSITGNEEYARLAEETLAYFGERLQERPISAPQMSTSLELQLDPPEATTSDHPC